MLATTCSCFISADTTTADNGGTIRVGDLAALHIPRNKALPFIVLPDHRPAVHLLDSAQLAERFKPKAKQLGFAF